MSQPNSAAKILIEKEIEEKEAKLVGLRSMKAKLGPDLIPIEDANFPRNEGFIKSIARVTAEIDDLKASLSILNINTPPADFSISRIEKIEAEMIKTIARTIFLHFYAKDGSGHDHVPIIDFGKEWSLNSPETPQVAINAAHRMVGMIEQKNDAALITLLISTAKSEGKSVEEITEKYASELAYFVSMDSLGNCPKSPFYNNVFATEEFLTPVFRHIVDVK